MLNAAMSRLSHADKVVLAPMVRVGTLPTRLLALRHGADIAYGEELIDYKMLQCKRLVNPVLGSVDYVQADGKCVFRTCPAESERVVFQMGTADPGRALKVAKMVENDVAGIDVNMGCPKEFSLKGGMGAALLRQPDKIKAILTTLVGGVAKPVTCKIRILPELEDTLKLARLIESTGVAALGVHGRTLKERSKDQCHNDVIREVARAISIPVIANGGSNNITNLQDIEAFRTDTGCSSVMVARAAERNPTVFRREGPPLPPSDVVREYLRLAVDWDNNSANSKYCVAQILSSELETHIGRALLTATSTRDMCAVWGEEQYHDSVMVERRERIAALTLQQQKELGVALFDPASSSDGAKRRRVEFEVSEEGVIELFVKFNRRDFANDASPKSALLEYTRRQHLGQPSYAVVERSKDRLFKATVTIGTEKYSSSFWAKSKRFAEQAAAMVALTVRGEGLPLSRT